MVLVKPTTKGKQGAGVCALRGPVGWVEGQEVVVGAEVCVLWGPAGRLFGWLLGLVGAAVGLEMGA